MKTISPLSEQEEKVMSSFKKKNKDVRISIIFHTTFGGKEWNDTKTVREMQQKLAPIFLRINEKLIPPARIEPGLLKQTYRYATTKSKS